MTVGCGALKKLLKPLFGDIIGDGWEYPKKSLNPLLTGMIDTGCGALKKFPNVLNVGEGVLTEKKSVKWFCTVVWYVGWIKKKFV